MISLSVIFVSNDLLLPALMLMVFNAAMLSITGKVLGKKPFYDMLTYENFS